MKRCEGLNAALDAHRKGERDAVAEVQELEEKLEELEYERDETINKSNERCYELEEENSVLKKENKKWTTRMDALQKRSVLQLALLSYSHRFLTSLVIFLSEKARGIRSASAYTGKNTCEANGHRMDPVATTYEALHK